MNVTACVDCATTILGDRLRCPACHDVHAQVVIEAADTAPEAEAITAPRPRVAGLHSPAHVLLAWLVAGEVLATIVFLVVLALRDC